MCQFALKSAQGFLVFAFCGEVFFCADQNPAGLGNFDTQKLMPDQSLPRDIFPCKPVICQTSESLDIPLNLRFIVTVIDNASSKNITPAFHSPNVQSAHKSGQTFFRHHPGSSRPGVAGYLNDTAGTGSNFLFADSVHKCSYTT